MAELIPTINWTDFLKVAKMGRLKELKSSEVNYDGEYLFTFVNGNNVPGNYLRTQTIYKCQVDNAVAGKNLEEIIKKEPVLV